MDARTVRSLNCLTRSFYDGSALGFCAANELPSPGWDQVLDLLEPGFSLLPSIPVLDGA